MRANVDMQLIIHVSEEFSSKMMKNGMFDTKKCTQEFGVFEIGVREKIFCALADVSDGFRKVVWDLGYPQN